MFGLTIIHNLIYKQNDFNKLIVTIKMRAEINIYNHWRLIGSGSTNDRIDGPDNNIR